MALEGPQKLNQQQLRDQKRITKNLQETCTAIFFFSSIAAYLIITNMADSHCYFLIFLEPLKNLLFESKAKQQLTCLFYF